MAKLTAQESLDLYRAIPFGRQFFYQSLREAGIRAAKPQRNIPWILEADDGSTIFCLWRSYMHPGEGGGVNAQMDVRTWNDHAKGRAVQVRLAQDVGKDIRVVVVEDGVPDSRTARSTSFDPMFWKVGEAKGDFLLSRTSRAAFPPGTSAEFTQRMLDLYEDAKVDLKYRASRFLATVRNEGGVMAAKKWMSASRKPTEGFERLFRNRRLDHSVEAIALNPRWQRLFTADELEIARSRLNEYGYFASPTVPVLNQGLVGPDEIDPHEEFPEGMRLRVEVNAYERDSQARELCISHYGSVCYVCEFNFERRYGAIGKGYIHVHHLNLVSGLGDGAKTNPIRDLRPVCPNCHAMLHKEKPPMPIGKLRSILNFRGGANKKRRRANK